jgi:hypothetical protein
MPISPRRIVPDVLLMPALKVCNPVEELIQMKIYDFASNAYRLSLRGNHVWPAMYILLPLFWLAALPEITLWKQR